MISLTLNLFPFRFNHIPSLHHRHSLTCKAAPYLPASLPTCRQRFIATAGAEGERGQRETATGEKEKDSAKFILEREWNKPRKSCLRMRERIVSCSLQDSLGTSSGLHPQMLLLREREVLLIEKRQSNAFKRPQMDALVIDRHPQRYGCTHARKEERKLLVMMSHHCLID